MEWYYAKDGKPEGPVSAAQLKQLAASGQLEPTDMVFKVGTKDWAPASSVAGLFPTGSGRSSAPAAPPTVEAPASFAFDEGKGAAPPARRKSSRDRVEIDDDDREPRARSARRGKGSFGDLLMFRRMIAPWVIMVIFWLGCLGYTGFGLFMIVMGIIGGTRGGVLPMLIGVGGGLLIIPAGILVVRLYCEMMIVVFRMNETLTDIKEVLERQRNG